MAHFSQAAKMGISYEVSEQEKVMLKIFAKIDPIDLAEQHHEYWLVASVGQFSLWAIFSADVSKKKKIRYLGN